MTDQAVSDGETITHRTPDRECRQVTGRPSQGSKVKSSVSGQTARPEAEQVICAEPEHSPGAAQEEGEIRAEN